MNARLWPVVLLAAALPLIANHSIAASQQSGTDSAPGSGSASSSLRGQVRHSDGTPFAQGAMVKAENELGGAGAQVQTDASGQFHVDSLAKARFTVTVSSPGYLDATQEVDLDTFPHAYLVFTLKPAPGPNGAPSGPSSLDPTVSAADLAAPPEAQSEYKKGRKLLLDEHKPKDSIAPFKKAIQIAPNYPLANFLLGTAYMDDQKWGDAEDALNKAIANNDKLGPAYLALGTCLNAEKKFSDAEEPLLKGLELDPDSAEGQYQLAWTYWSLGRWQDADPHARKSLSLDATKAAAHLVMGNILLRERNGKDAYHEFNEYLRLDPKGEYADATRDLVKRLDKALTDAGIAH